MNEATQLLYERIVMLEAEYNKERDRADRLARQYAELLAVCIAASHALRSYQYGAPELAQGVADSVDAAIAKARGTDVQP
jgi:hypothetical protein